MFRTVLCLACVLSLVLVLACAPALADDSGRIKLNGNYFRLSLFGSSGGEHADLVLASLPFQLPEEGEVILLRCVKLGSQITPPELAGVVEAFRLYNRRTESVLLPVSAITLPQTSSIFDLLFYENTVVDPADYCVLCNGEEYTFEHMNDYSPDLRVLRDPPEVLPTMPPEGGFLAEFRPEYCEPAERLLQQADAGELTLLDGDPQFGEKLAVVVFSSQYIVWKTTLDETDPLRELFPADRLAASWEEADTVVLVSKRAVAVGTYGITAGTARRVDTLVTVVDMRRQAMYPVSVAASSDPPSSIKTLATYTGGAEGTYEYEKAVTQIANQLK